MCRHCTPPILVRGVGSHAGDIALKPSPRNARGDLRYKFSGGRYHRSHPVEVRFWAKVDKRGPDDCWKWQAGGIKLGYGMFKWNGISWLVHRVAWTLTYGPIPIGLCVLHNCDNPPCCNPEHLFLGTRADNNADKMKKGRWRAAPKPRSKNGRSKLTENQVIEIRHRRSLGEKLRSIADDYPVGYKHISDICKRDSWTHV
jgi:hypothetical protein